MMKFLILIFAALSAWGSPQGLPARHTATVTETMDAGGYTYMKVNESGNTYWVAVTAAAVKVGERVTFDEQMWMPNFKSRALDRTFDRILFATMAFAPSQHPPIDTVKPENAPKTAMQKAEGGYSVGEVFENRSTLMGKTVTVRGKVTKVSRQIMKRNWVHLEDGTGGPMSDDLVFTTENDIDIQAGDTVTATGTAETDKDFGFGYFYPVIIEQSSFTKEP